jgi:GntR family transcriptional repressor for pyruvate dehydrogenase complex
MANIDAALARIDAEVAAGGDGVDADVGFHRTIAEATGNHVFPQDTGIPEPVPGNRHPRHATAKRGASFRARYEEEHQAIVAAIRAGDPDAARNAAQNHMYNAARRLSQLGEDDSAAGDQPAGPSH